MCVRKFTDEQEQEICSRYEAGEMTTALSKELGVTSKTISNILRRCGVKARPASISKQALSHELQLKACRLYESGLSYAAVAKAIGKSYGATQRAINRNGVEGHETIKDITGQRFGRLVAQKRLMSNGKTSVWQMSCDCGKTVHTRLSNLQSGSAQSCGCLRSELTSSRMAKDLQDEVFGLLRPVAKVGNHPRTGESIWNCSCACGGQKDVMITKLTQGHVQSCGCLTRGYDCIATLLDGSFYAANTDSEFYVYSLQNHALVKPGIDSTGRRADSEYGEKLFSAELERQQAWLLEQAYLHETRLLAKTPSELADWCGATEIRDITEDAAVALAIELHQEFLELGMWEFAARYVPMTAAQRAICQQRALEVVAA